MQLPCTCTSHIQLSPWLLTTSEVTVHLVFGVLACTVHVYKCNPTGTLPLERDTQNLLIFQPITTSYTISTLACIAHVGTHVMQSKLLSPGSRRTTSSDFSHRLKLSGGTLHRCRKRIIHLASGYPVRTYTRHTYHRSSNKHFQYKHLLRKCYILLRR